MRNGLRLAQQEVVAHPDPLTLVIVAVLVVLAATGAGP